MSGTLVVVAIRTLLTKCALVIYVFIGYATIVLTLLSSRMAINATDINSAKRPFKYYSVRIAWKYDLLGNLKHWVGEN